MGGRPWSPLPGMGPTAQKPHSRGLPGAHRCSKGLFARTGAWCRSLGDWGVAGARGPSFGPLPGMLGSAPQPCLAPPPQGPSPCCPFYCKVGPFSAPVSPSEEPAPEDPPHRPELSHRPSQAGLPLESPAGLEHTDQLLDLHPDQSEMNLWGVVT